MNNQQDKPPRRPAVRDALLQLVRNMEYNNIRISDVEEVINKIIDIVIEEVRKENEQKRN